MITPKGFARLARNTSRQERRRTLTFTVASVNIRLPGAWGLGCDFIFLAKNHIFSLKRSNGGWVFSIKVPHEERVVEIQGFHAEGLVEAIRTSAKAMRAMKQTSQEPGVRFPNRHGGD